MLYSAQASSATKYQYDWNDGTVQGWSSSSAATNTESRLQGNNSGNGSLQIWAPNTSYSLEETDVISFDFTLLTYSTAVDAFCDAEPGYYRAEDAGFFTGQWVRPDGTMGNDFMGFDEWMCQRE